MAKDTVTTTIQYLEWQDIYEREKPFLLLFDLPDNAKDRRTSNLVFKAKTLTLHDIRASETPLTLDENGFMVKQSTTQVTDFANRKYVDENYLPEAEKLLREQVEGVDRVYFFDWRVRDSIGIGKQMEDDDGVRFDESLVEPPPQPEELAYTVRNDMFDLNDFTTVLNPAPYAHVDQTPSSVLSRIKLQLPNDAEYLLRGRVRVINLWRPLRNHVEDFPLAVCDGSTMPESDLIEADHVRRKYSGATYYCLANESNKWYYMSHQQPGEVLLMKMFDSDENVKAKYCPHAAVKLPNISHGTPSRKSIELRAMVFTYPQD